MRAITQLVESAKNDTSTQVLILTNILSLLMAIVLEWDVLNLILLYWLETAAIGFFAIVKTVHSVAVQKLFNNVLMKLILVFFLVGFFVLHFGGFMLGHYLFIYAFFGDSNLFIPVIIENIPLIPDSIDLTSILIGFAFLFSSHLFSFWHNYIGKKEYRFKVGLDYFFSPYSRIAVMHLTIMFGGLLAMLLNVYFALILLSVLKIITDVRAHRNAHRF